MLTAERLRHLLHYEPETGAFTWLVDVAYHIPAGTPARMGLRKGYPHVGIDGRSYAAHRLAWLYMTGEWPPDQIDHENMRRADCRWENLRLATNGENSRNRVAQSNSRSGRKGVSLCCTTGLWRVTITRDGRQRTIGRFRDIDVASAAYAAAAAEYHEQFARTA